jgi:hypothetical protein
MAKDRPPTQDDAATREARERHRAEGADRITGKHTAPEIVDTTGEGGVGGSISGAYIEQPGAHNPDPPEGTLRRTPQELGDQQYISEHGPQGDASDDLTSERAEEVLEEDAQP